MIPGPNIGRKAKLLGVLSVLVGLTFPAAAFAQAVYTAGTHVELVSSAQSIQPGQTFSFNFWRNGREGPSAEAAVWISGYLAPAR